MTVRSTPATPERSPLKQQTLDSLVRKGKTGRNLGLEKQIKGDVEVVKELCPVVEKELVDTKKEVIKNTKRETKKSEVVKKSRTRHPKSRSTVAVADEKNQKLTDYFPVRRSKRQPLSKIKDQEYQDLVEKINSKSTDGLEVREIEGKGRGIFSNRHFARKEFVVEYSGTLISWEEAKKREEKYAKEPETYGCYMYYFSFKNRKYCVDGTAEDGSMGRLLNHSLAGNVESKLVNIANRPVLILIAKTEIPPETELVYDYGERDKTAIESHPWLAQ